MSLARWVRQTSEHYLMIEAQAAVARKYNAREPLPPRGVAVFWRRIYVPIFHRMPLPLRDAIIAKMPGSHRKSWRRQVPPRGPAV